MWQQENNDATTTIASDETIHLSELFSRSARAQTVANSLIWADCNQSATLRMRVDKSSFAAASLALAAWNCRSSSSLTLALASREPLQVRPLLLFCASGSYANANAAVAVADDDKK